MHLAYYLTAHGYGHAVRASAITNALHPGVAVTFRTAIPPAFFEAEMTRPFSREHGEFDCGCVQTDSVTIDVPATLHRYALLAERNRRVLEQEVAWCTRNRISAIVSDIVPFAFEVAAAAGIPSIAATNFSWFDIYSQYTPSHPDFAPHLEEIAGQYETASILLALHPARSLPHFPRVRPMPVVGRKGVTRTGELRDFYGIAPHKRLALIYVGNFGMDDVPWHALPQFGDWEFLGLHPLPGDPATYHVVDKRRMPYQDLCASVNLVIGKIGYGTYAESLLNGVPLLYLPRENFAEFHQLECAVREWGHGYRLESDAFRAMTWGTVLETVADTPRPYPVPSTGAGECARLIEETAMLRTRP